MPKKIRVRWPNGVNVYGQLSPDGSTVWVWTKDRNIGGYRIERFRDHTLTAKNLETLLKGE